MIASQYSKRLGVITDAQFQSALDKFDLGRFVGAQAIPFGLFGQNVFLVSTKGEFVLRGVAHYAWQFPEEQFIAKLLHEQTPVPTPWPYLVDTDETIFGWKHGYAVMPRMPGLQLADKNVVSSLTASDRHQIAFALGDNLSDIQKAHWPVAGRYDLETKTAKPFDGDFGDWIIAELRQWLQKSLSYDTGMTWEDEEWVEQLITQSEESLHQSFAPVLVLHDYKEANVAVTKDGANWKVSGVFDLMEALFGDGELDLVRQLSSYMNEDMELAQVFLQGYQHRSSLRPGAKDRLALYMTYDRLIMWEYFHRPEHLSMWWYDAKKFRDWLQPYLDKLEQIV